MDTDGKPGTLSLMTYLHEPLQTHAPEGHGNAEPFHRRHVLAITICFVSMAFLAAPWPFEVKAHAVMHGLCAQTPGHTISIDHRPLPFDGRMTGIYSGVLASLVVLMSLGRHRAAGLPSNGAVAVLVLFLGAMAVDGVNSLLTDLGAWHPYGPSNELRLLTGWMAGISIGTVLMMLTGMLLWYAPSTEMRILPAWWWPILSLLPLLVIRPLLTFDSSPVYFLYSVLLMASAVIAFTTLVLCSTLMLANRENGFDRFSQILPLTAFSMVVAIGLILMLSGGRFWLESAIGVVSQP